MNSDDVDALVRPGESFQTEFKSDRKHSLNDRDLVAAVVCLANGSGGRLLIGVEDDGTVTGAAPRHGDSTDPLRLQATISNLTNPPVTTSVEIVSHPAGQVVVIIVDEASTITGTSAGLYVRRALRVDGRPECVPFPATEMLASRIERGEVDYATIAEPNARLEDLDPEEFDRFRRLAALSSATADRTLGELSDVDVGRALGVLSVDRDAVSLTRGAILLFGRQDSIRRLIPTHEVAFQVLSHQSISANEFTHKPLFATAEELFSFTRAQNRESEIDVGLLRVAVDRIPDVVARELIANSLVHRDYTRLGAVRVVVNDDVLEIVNPGGFPRGVTLSNYLDASQPRSRILADAFLRAGLVERTGRGINRVFESVLRSGRDQPDYSRSSEDHVAVSVAIDDSDLPLVRFVLEQESATGRTFGLADLQVLHELRREPRMAVGDLSEVMQKSPLQSKSTLVRLVESGLVEARGDGRGRRYSLSPASYRALAESSAYVRVRPFDTLQQEQMVLTYVASHGRITRREVAELCGLTPMQALRLLRTLVESGKLELRGERRGSHYVAST